MQGEGNVGETPSFAFAVLCLVLAVIYAILGYLVLTQDKAISDNDTATMEYDDSENESFVQNIAKLWMTLCAVSLFGLLVALVVTIVPLFQEDGERARQEGEVWGLLVAILYIMLIVGIFFKVGSNVFDGNRSEKQVTIGAFSGGLLFFAALACLLAVLHGSFQVSSIEYRLGATRSCPPVTFGDMSNQQFALLLLSLSLFAQGEGQPEQEGATGSMVFSILLFLLMVLHGAFACGILWYSQAILHANAKDRASLPFFRMSWKSSSKNNNQGVV